MPYKFETQKMKIGKENNRNIKLTLDDRKEIAKLYKTGYYSQRGLAKMFGVSRALIRYYSDESGERLKRDREKYNERKKDGRYYNKERQREYAKRVREHKKELYKRGLLING